MSGTRARGRLLERLAACDWWRKATPACLRTAARRLMATDRYNQAVWARNNPHLGTDREWQSGGLAGARLGIVFDVSHYHRYFIQACLDMDVPYRVVDIRFNDWVSRVRQSGCDGFLVWPTLHNPVLKEMFDERLRLMVEDLGCHVTPSPGSIWLLDNKRRVRDWLVANQIPHPATWCFFDQDEALEFLRGAKYPVVFKMVRGSVSHGVAICRSSLHARRLVRRCFTRGVLPYRGDPRARQRGFAMFQEFLPNVEEHRMIRVGESFLSIRKVRKGDFHSGSGEMRWSHPPRELLELTRTITTRSGFESMNVDFFLAHDCRVLVNELHALFHGPVIPDGEAKGRYLLDSESNEWRFEPGNHYRNYCANLRVQELLREIGDESAAGRWSWLEKPIW